MHGFPRGCRLHLKKDFEAVIKTGKRLQHGGITLWWKPAPFGRETKRMGLVVSRKLGPAVVRNRAKRLLREAFRLNRDNITSGVDLVLNPKDSQQAASLAAAQEALLALCKKAGILDYPSQNE